MSQLSTAILVDADSPEPLCLRMDSLDLYINRAPLNNESDRSYRSFKRVHVVEDGHTPVGIYARNVKDADAKAIGLKEADKILNPEKYRRQHDELQSLRQENARLRSELAASAVAK